MSTLAENLDVIRRYLKAIEDGTFADLAGLFTPEMTIEQLPNRIYPNGIRSNLARMAEGFKTGRKLLSAQIYEIKNALANGDYVAVEVLWTGTLAVSFGTLSPGSQMRAHSAMFFEFNNGKIASQRNYDCFEPW
jgi:ketosteroid isomerase-like protein